LLPEQLLEDRVILPTTVGAGVGAGEGSTSSVDASNNANNSKGKGKAKAKAKGSSGAAGNQELNKVLKDGGIIGVGDVADGDDDMRTAADRGDGVVWEWCRDERASASSSSGSGGGGGKRSRKKEEGVTIFVGAFDDEELDETEVHRDAVHEEEGEANTAPGGDTVAVVGEGSSAASKSDGDDRGKWARELNLLQEMGFSNVAALLPLLKTHNGDVGAVIDASM